MECVIRQLSAADAQALLAFEWENREWFKAHIEPRPPAFYCLEGVTTQIEAYLSGLAAATWAPYVIEGRPGHIVGRANLKDIDVQRRCAEVGYRIARHACGQGLATRALEHLIAEARGRWGLVQLVAYAYADNVGSQKVLARCGFTPDAPEGADDTRRERRFTCAL